MTYTEDLPGLGHFRLRPVDPARDADTIHEWVTQPRAEFWGMTGHSRDDVREIYEFLDGLDTHHAYLMTVNDRPVGIFQTYQPAADPIGEHYPVRDGDFGIHLFMAPASAQQGEIKDFTGRVFSALMRFVQVEPGHRRIVIEPDVRNERSLRRWKRLGFAFGERVELPHKVAQMAYLDLRPTPAK